MPVPTILRTNFRELPHIAFADVPARHPVGVMLRHWSDWGGDRQCIGWTTFDPIAFPKLLPWVLLLRPEEDGCLRYAVSGGKCDRMFGIRYQGKVFGEGLPPEAVAARREEFDIAVNERRALLSRVKIPLEGKDHTEIYRGVFPFLSEHGALERLLVLAAPVDLRI